MIRKQVFIEEQQERRLKALAARLGVAEAVLIREGIDKMLAEKERDDDDWKKGLLKVLEMEGDFEGLDETVAKNRKRWKERTDQLVKSGLIGKVASTDAT